MQDQIKELEHILAVRNKEIAYLTKKLDHVLRRAAQSELAAKQNLSEANKRYSQIALELRKSQTTIEELCQTIDAITRLESM